MHSCPTLMQFTCNYVRVNLQEASWTTVMFSTKVNKCIFILIVQCSYTVFEQITFQVSNIFGDSSKACTHQPCTQGTQCTDQLCNLGTRWLLASDTIEPQLPCLQHWGSNPFFPLLLRRTPQWQSALYRAVTQQNSLCFNSEVPWKARKNCKRRKESPLSPCVTWDKEFASPLVNPW